MGRKSSNKKKARLEKLTQGPPPMASDKKLEMWVMSIMSFSTFWLLWSIYLSYHAFIPEKVIFLTTLAGGVLAILPLILFRERSIPVKPTIPFKCYEWIILAFFYGYTGTGLSLFLLIGINHYAPRETPATAKLPVLKTGIHHSSRPGKRYPYATVIYDGVENDIRFDKRYTDSVLKAREVELKLEKGIWGYYIYTDKKFF